MVAGRIVGERVVTLWLAGYICVVFGIGGQEIVLIGILFLVIFGPSKLPQMARDLGRFVNDARRSVDEFKGELIGDDDDDDDDDDDEDDDDEDRRPKRKH